MFDGRGGGSLGWRLGSEQLWSHAQTQIDDGGTIYVDQAGGPRGNVSKGMATTPLGGRLPNVNRKGSSPCVGGSGNSSSQGQRKQQQQERTGRDHHHHHHHHHHRHHQSKSGHSSSHHHHHHHNQNQQNNSSQHHRGNNKQQQQIPERQSQQPDQQSSTMAAHAGELDPAATNATNNFEYDDNEWDIGIGDLIIDLDADIGGLQQQFLISTFG